MERSNRYSYEARGISSRFALCSLAPLGFILVLGHVYALGVSTDGGVVIGVCTMVVAAYNTVDCALLWQKTLPQGMFTLRIHGNVVVLPVQNGSTVVLDVTTGHQLHDLPSAGKSVGIFVFDGLTRNVNVSVCFMISPMPLF